MIDVEEEFDEIEEELGIAEEKKLDAQIRDIRAELKFSNYLLKQILGWLIAISLFAIIGIIVIIFYLYN